MSRLASYPTPRPVSAVALDGQLVLLATGSGPRDARIYLNPERARQLAGDLLAAAQCVLDAREAGA